MSNVLYYFEKEMYLLEFVENKNSNHICTKVCHGHISIYGVH